MPPTQRKLTSFPSRSRPLKVQGATQKRLHELKKVVSIKGGAVNFDVEELTIAKDVFENERSSDEEILESLRRLSSSHDPQVQKYCSRIQVTHFPWLSN